MDLSNRIQYLIDKYGTIKGFASIIGVTPMTIMRWKQGKADINRSNLVKISEITGVSISWLATGNGSPENDVLDDDPCADKFIDITDSQLVNGVFISKSYKFRQDWINKITNDPSKLAIYRAKDDSMSPSINKGDMALVEMYHHKTDNRIKQGCESLDGLTDGLYIVRINNRLILRRLQFSLGGQILIKPDNKLFDAFTFSQNELEPPNIVGKVLWYCHEV